jgi:hypothetical protein
MARYPQAAGFAGNVSARLVISAVFVTIDVSHGAALPAGEIRRLRRGQLNAIRGNTNVENHHT